MQTCRSRVRSLTTIVKDDAGRLTRNLCLVIRHVNRNPGLAPHSPRARPWRMSWGLSRRTRELQYFSAAPPAYVKALSRKGNRPDGLPSLCRTLSTSVPASGISRLPRVFDSCGVIIGVAATITTCTVAC